MIAEKELAVHVRLSGGLVDGGSDADLGKGGLTALFGSGFQSDPLKE
jgi:hypothetical protein